MDFKNQTMKNQEILNSFNEKLKAAEESVLYLRQAKSSFERLIKEEQSEPADVPNEPSDLCNEKTCPETKLEIKKLDSVKSIEAEIKMLQSKLEFYKELEKEPEMLLMRQGKVDIVDYNKTTYYRIEYTTDFARSFNWYERKNAFSSLWPIPNNGPLFEVEVLEKYYQKEVMKQKQEYPYKKYTEEETEQSLKEAFKKAQQSEKWKEIQKLIDEEDNDKNFKNSLDLIKEWGEKNKPKTLYGILQEWWNDILAKNSDLDFDISIDYLVDLIDTKFIPPSSKFNSYECEKCLKMMRDNLRDT